DPFECKVVLDLDAPHELRREHFRKNRPNGSEAEFDSWESDLERGKWFAEMTARRDVLAHFGIACFTRTWDNLLMWAHYGRDHTGFCLGFDEASLRDWPGLFAHGDVLYTEKAPAVRAFYDEGSEQIRKVIFHKAT